MGACGPTPHPYFCKFIIAKGLGEQESQICDTERLRPGRLFCLFWGEPRSTPTRGIFIKDIIPFRSFFPAFQTLLRLAINSPKMGLPQGWERSSQTPRSGTQFGIKP